MQERIQGGPNLGSFQHGRDKFSRDSTTCRPVPNKEFQHQNVYSN